MQPGELGVKDMQGVKVTFHCTNFWVHGRKIDILYHTVLNRLIVYSALLCIQPGELGVKDMRGVKVTFHRTNFWVYGRKKAI